MNNRLINIKINKGFIFTLMYVVIFPAIAAYYCWQKAIELIDPTDHQCLLTYAPFQCINGNNNF